MKMHQWIRNVVCIGSVFALNSANSAQAQTSLEFDAFETEGVGNLADLNFIDIDGLVVAAAGGVKIGIYNNSIPGDGWVTASIPTITSIFFQDKTGVLGNVLIAETFGTVDFARNDGANLPGGNGIGFVVDNAFTAVPPPVTNGLDPNEYAYFFFSGSDYASVVAAIGSGDVKVGMHVQQIGKNGADSAAFVNAPIPEPTVALLGGIGLLALLRRRRF